MLRIISSKNDSEIFSIARKEREKAKIKSNFLDCSIFESLGLSENVSIFGDKESYMIKLSKAEELESISKNLLGALEESEHFFVIVGSGADFDKKIMGEGGKVIKIEEKRVFDFPAELVSALQKHDRKNSWKLLLEELHNKEAEPIHGSCIFAYKTLLVYLNDPKKNSPLSGVKDFSWKQAKSAGTIGKREREEVSDKYFSLIDIYHQARMGKGNLEENLEKWVLDK
jgi:hypothetical protein